MVVRLKERFETEGFPEIMKFIAAKFQITEEKLVKKRTTWLKQCTESAELKQGRLHPFAESAQFIRTVQNHLFSPKTIKPLLLPVYKERMSVYLGAKT